MLEENLYHEIASLKEKISYLESRIETIEANELFLEKTNKEILIDKKEDFVNSVNEQFNINNCVNSVAKTSLPNSEENSNKLNKKKITPAVYDFGNNQTKQASFGHSQNPKHDEMLNNETMLKPIDVLSMLNEQSTKTKNQGEAMLAKNILSILAAVLIFFGVVSFGVLTYQKLSEAAKVAFMFAFSFSLTGVGFYLENKKQNFVGTAVFATGLSSVYISLLCTYMFFNFLNEYSFFALAGVWILAMIALSLNFNKYLYCVIGKFGLVVSVFFGLSMYKTQTQFIIIVVYFAVITYIYLLFIPKIAEIGKFIIIGLSVFLSIAVTCFVLEENIFVAEIILLVYSLLFLIYGFIIPCKIENRTHASLVSLLTVLPALLMTSLMIPMIFELNAIEILIGFYALSVLIVVFSKLETYTNFVSDLYCGILAFLLMICWQDSVFEVTIKFVSYLPIIVPLMIYSVYKKSEGLFAESIVAFGVVALSLQAQFANWVYIILFFICFFKSNLVYKYRAVFFTFILFCTNTAVYEICDFVHSSAYSRLISLCVTSVISIIFVGRNFAGEVADFKQLFNKKNNANTNINTYLKLVNGFLILTLLGYMNYSISNVFVDIIIVLITSAGVFVGVKELLVEQNKKWVGFYIGVKFTLYINYIIYSFINYSYNSYLLSIICLILALFFIYYGFDKKITSFRLYGLYLSIVSVIKLVLVDFNYENSISKVFSFIASGVICFGIVWMYTKKTAEDGEIESERKNNLK